MSILEHKEVKTLLMKNPDVKKEYHKLDNIYETKKHIIKLRIKNSFRLK